MRKSGFRYAASIGDGLRAGLSSAAAMQRVFRNIGLWDTGESSGNTNDGMIQAWGNSI
jgi:hypothetical protein